MRIRDTRLAALAAAGLWMCVAAPAQAACETANCTKPNATTANAPIVLSKFTRQKSHASAKAKSKSARAEHGAKIADAASRKMAAKSATKAGAQMDSSRLPPSVANARADFTTIDPGSRAEDQARNIAAADDNEIVTMDGVQIASADQFNDIDRAMADDKTELKADDTAVVGPAPAAASGRILKAVPSVERHVFAGDDPDPWSKTSLIGKIFVAFGSLLTLASAARLIFV